MAGVIITPCRPGFHGLPHDPAWTRPKPATIDSANCALTVTSLSRWACCCPKGAYSRQQGEPRSRRIRRRSSRAAVRRPAPGFPDGASRSPWIAPAQLEEAGAKAVARFLASELTLATARRRCTSTARSSVPSLGGRGARATSRQTSCWQCARSGPGGAAVATSRAPTGLASCASFDGSWLRAGHACRTTRQHAGSGAGRAVARRTGASVRTRFVSSSTR